MTFYNRDKNTHFFKLPGKYSHWKAVDIMTKWQNDNIVKSFQWEMSGKSSDFVKVFSLFKLWDKIDKIHVHTCGSFYFICLDLGNRMPAWVSFITLSTLFANLIPSPDNIYRGGDSSKWLCCRVIFDNQGNKAFWPS